ncbi:MAG: hypothetical protein IPH93_02965 [Saprospiraceae bacterium]|nr:hypothetical protein [Saprospiraceae bacterium]MBK7810453.1 hypothetical protein [Saprospiraceae bacterium]MBK9630045.1 hypothetical protein [Saprospiraceae bacterium]
MKNLFILSTFVLFVFACKNADQFRAPIETLTADWAKTATMVGEATTEVNNTISGLTSMTDSMNVAPGTKLAANVTTMLDSLKNSYTAQVQGLGALTTEINAFTEKWTAMSADVDSLNAGLKNGNLEGDVMAKINTLNEAITGANTATATWKSTAAATKEAAMGLYNMYMEKAMGK